MKNSWWHGKVTPWDLIWIWPMSYLMLALVGSIANWINGYGFGLQ